MRITSRTHAHCGGVTAAVNAGKWVYLDKPISVTLEDDAAIRQAEIWSGQAMLTGFTRRYDQPWINAIGLVATLFFAVFGHMPKIRRGLRSSAPPTGQV